MGEVGKMKPKLTAKDVIVSRNNIYGIWECSAMVGNHREHRLYVGFTKRQAVRGFLKEMNGKQE